MRAQHQSNKSDHAGSWVVVVLVGLVIAVAGQASNEDLLIFCALPIVLTGAWMIFKKMKTPPLSR